MWSHFGYELFIQKAGLHFYQKNLSLSTDWASGNGYIAKQQGLLYCRKHQKGTFGE